MGGRVDRVIQTPLAPAQSAFYKAVQEQDLAEILRP